MKKYLLLIASLSFVFGGILKAQEIIAPSPNPLLSDCFKSFQFLNIQLFVYRQGFAVAINGNDRNDSQKSDVSKTITFHSSSVLNASAEYLSDGIISLSIIGVNKPESEHPETFLEIYSIAAFESVTKPQKVIDIALPIEEKVGPSLYIYSFQTKKIENDYIVAWDEAPYWQNPKANIVRIDGKGAIIRSAKLEVSPEMLEIRKVFDKPELVLFGATNSYTSAVSSNEHRGGYSFAAIDLDLRLIHQQEVGGNAFISVSPLVRDLSISGKQDAAILVEKGFGKYVYFFSPDGELTNQKVPGNSTNLEINSSGTPVVELKNGNELVLKSVAK